jgi:hypothetical protein
MKAYRLCIEVAAWVLLCPLAGRTQGTNRHWTAPADPDPQKILQEAEADTRAGRYEDSLAKHIWFHENALNIQPAQYGVRLSFALSDWVKLGESYPPALEKLKSIRDQDEKKIRQGKSSRGIFHDFEAINKELKETSRTKDTFIWLDSNAPTFAKEVFDIAEPDLVRAKEYRLCNKYLDPNNSFQHMLDLYKETMEIAKNSQFGKRTSEYDQKEFSNSSATLVALLAVNGRTAEANDIATKATAAYDDPQFKSLLQKAKKGEVPAPWP